MSYTKEEMKVYNRKLVKEGYFKKKYQENREEIISKNLERYYKNKKKILARKRLKYKENKRLDKNN